MIYTFQNKISGEIHEVEMSMSDYAPYKGPDGKDDEWEGFEDVVRVTGQEGHAPEIVTIGGCVCGHQQEVAR